MTTVFRYLLLSLCFLASTFVFCQVQTFYVKPIQTDAAYSATEDSSAISINTSNSRNQLFLFFGGTGSSSSINYNALRLRAANLGYHVINLSYPNSVAAASLKNNTDSLAFTKYRQELCFGTSLSSAVDVDSFNSIYTRILKTLTYLNQTFPAQNWGQYLASAHTINWSKIALGGHSQGSGHACYLAKKFKASRVLMFAGPNDFSDHFVRSANWLKAAGLTAINKHYSYLSIKDEVVNYHKQFTNISGLGMLANDDSTYVDEITSPFNNSNCLYTRQAPGIGILNHNSPTKFSTKNNEVWDYMLTDLKPMSMPHLINHRTVHYFPNPASQEIYLDSDLKLVNSSYYIHNLKGEQLLEGKITNSEKMTIDLADLPTGFYILRVAHSTFKIEVE